MWRNRSLIYPAVTFLLVAIGVTLAVGYAINYAILEDVLRERMARQAEQVGGDVRQALEKKITQLERFQESWTANSGSDLLDPESPEAAWKRLDNLFPLWGVDFILLLDPDGRVIQRMPRDFGGGSPLPMERVAGDLPRQAPLWRVAEVEGAWRILLFAPVGPRGVEKPHIVVFGQSLSRIVAGLQRENPSRPFLIAGENGVVAGSAQEWAGARYLQESATATIRENRARMAFDSDLPVNLYHAPLPVLDRTFALVVPIPLEEARRVLTNSRQRLIGSMGFIVLLLAGLGLAMERILLRPLRQLREKAAAMVRACSGEEQALHFGPETHGNEIAMLDRAMAEASVKLYAHVAHLVDTKQLLEGLALKDPVTLLGNRRMLDEFLGITLGGCRRKQRPLALLLVAPEQMTVPFGAEDRNRILRELAERLCKQLRGEDLAFRLEGDEFVAFAPECGDEEQVLALVFRLHRALAQPYPLAAGQVVTIDIRLGVALFPESGDQGETLLANARSALELARRSRHYPFAIHNHPEATDPDAND
ncbi:MAG: GGDEF domain-containing protein [Magnetococcales bacterium]|nr:GGDEF domain-containing protein [Magnetococcales bacterium]